MSELPSGTVTFMFTDIEGSTRLLTRLRGRYGEVLGEHQGLLRAAFAEHHGREVHTEGDAFFVAFARASDAIAAAVTAQRALACKGWPEGADVRVRIGVHTGEAEVRMDDYVGLDVHRAARICAAGHGGQVLISGATRELVADELPADVALKDLGEHRLKDLDRPEHLFQLVVGDLPADFPPLMSLSRDGANALPTLPNRTIGRADDVRAVVDRLHVDDVRLLTLTGPGGVGKTRLAVEVAHAAQGDFADGAYFVSLAALRTPHDLPSAIVKALSIVVLSGESTERAAERFLSAKHLLLAVDNFEHVLTAAPLIGRLLHACPALTVLATSREPLGLQAEERYPVSPLAVDRAVALFCARARAQDPGFDLDDANTPAVVEICRRLDGLPLAIELAAARCGLLSPDEIAARLHDALAVLGPGARDAPERQQTLSATIDWSHELLTGAEQQSFARFAVFAGGATVQAAETITHAGLDALDGLVAKSLLVRDQRTDTPTRVWMLKTIHAYADERFALTTDKGAVHERHYRHYLELAQRHGDERALWGTGAKQHLATLDADIDNIHAALGWAIEQANAGRALAMAATLGCYWSMRKPHEAAEDWIDQALRLPGTHAHPALRVRALRVKKTGLWLLGRGAEQPAVIAEAEAIAREVGDPALLSQALQDRVDYYLGIGWREDESVDQLAAATRAADEALYWARRTGDGWQIARAFRRHALVAPTFAELRERVDRAASLLQDAGNAFDLVGLLGAAAYAGLWGASDRDAKELIDAALPIARGLDDPMSWLFIQGNFGLATLLTGDTDAAAHAFREELSLCRELVARPFAAEGLRGLAAVAVVRGDTDRAARLVGAAAAHRYGQPVDPVEARLDAAFFQPARTRYGASEWDAAARAAGELSFDAAIVYALDDPR
jgi:predicted ATPase/class 3 adenylate cyclase